MPFVRSASGLLRPMSARGGAPLLNSPGNVAAPAIVTPPSGLTFDMATAGRRGVPGVNDQFEYITYARDWPYCFNNATEGFAGVRWQPTWIRAEGFYGSWEPANGHVFRAYRKGASGQDAQTLVLVTGPNPGSIPPGDPVVLFTSPGEGSVNQTSALNISGYNLPLRQKMTVLSCTPSAPWDTTGSRIIEIDCGTSLPAIDYTPPGLTDSWYTASTLQVRHWRFYSDEANKVMRHPIGWFSDISKNDILANGGYVMLGGVQFIPTWTDWSREYMHFGASLTEELWRKECQGLADYFGDTDPRRLAVELENEPTREWRNVGDGPGYGDLLPDVWYGIARQVWGPSRTLVVKSTGFGSLDSLLTEFDFACPTGDNAHLVIHNYEGQITWPNGKMAFEGIAQTDWVAARLSEKIAQLGYKGGGMTEIGVNTVEFWDYTQTIPNAERGRRLGRMLTSLTAKDLYMFAWGAVGDSLNCVEIRDVGGHNIEAYWSDIAPYARRAGITTT